MTINRRKRCYLPRKAEVRQCADIYPNKLTGNCFEYMPNCDEEQATIKINGEDVQPRPRVHTLTSKKRTGRQERKRHLLNSRMSARLQSVLITPEVATDVVKVHFPCGTKNAVLFANSRSKNKYLLHLYALYKNLRNPLVRLFESIPLNFFTPDHLAGGFYVPFGLGTIAPGPKGCGPRWKKLQRPFLRRSAVHKTIRKLFEIYGKLMGAMTEAIADLLPEFLKENQELGKSADDCAYPTPSSQHQGSSGTEGFLHWFSNQCIVRAIGKKVGTYLLDEAKIALHCDSTDFSCRQPLMFLPMGGNDNSGGHVEGTDLVCFQSEGGGLSFRVKTTIEDTVVIVLMNSSKQLHGGVEEEGNGEETGESPYWSMRFINYCPCPVINFIKERRKDNPGSRPIPFTNLNIQNGDEHSALNRELVSSDGIHVASEYGKTKVWWKAIARKEADKSITLHWSNGTHTPKWKRRLYHVDCIYPQGESHGCPCVCEQN